MFEFIKNINNFGPLGSVNVDNLQQTCSEEAVASHANASWYHLVVTSCCKMSTDLLQMRIFGCVCLIKHKYQGLFFLELIRKSGCVPQQFKIARTRWYYFWIWGEFLSWIKLIFGLKWNDVKVYGHWIWDDFTGSLDYRIIGNLRNKDDVRTIAK